jgi:hypothetical protein
MANSKLLKEAIADAKAVKETALANAKLALEEAFTPRLQSILSQKLRQEAEMGDDEEMQNEELDSSDIGGSDVMGKTPGKQPSLDADTDLSVGVKKSSGNSATAVSDYTKTKDINEEEGMGMDDEKDQEIAELRARLAELEGGESSDDEMGMEDEGAWHEGDDMGGDDMGDDGEDYDVTGNEEQDTEEDDMDLESIIRELEAQLGEEESTDDEPTEEDESMYEDMADGSEAGTDKGEDPKVVMTTEEEGEDKEDVIDLEEILREMEADMKNEDEMPNPAKAGEDGSLKAELKQAYSTIKSLQGTINEVNLLNAKLLFANKLFRAHNMTNEQKVKVIETLDRTKSVREVKLVYSTLAENFKYTTTNKVAKKSITEGYASKVVKSTKPAVAQKQVIAESADFSDRFKKLAGIIK